MLEPPKVSFYHNYKELEVKEPEEKLPFRMRWFPTFKDLYAVYSDAPKNREKFGEPVIGEIQFLMRWVRNIGIAGALFYSVYQGIGNKIEYSQGQKIGVISKISEEGLFWKTKEGQLSLEERTFGFWNFGFWNFSLDNSAENKENLDGLYSKLKEYSEKGQKVKITYKQPLAVWPWRASTRYLVQDIEPLEKIE